MLTCDCGAEPDEPHAANCIHHQLPTDNPSDHYDQ
jgi:hypothetical protein